jgi:hypothetical protein
VRNIQDYNKYFLFKQLTFLAEAGFSVHIHTHPIVLQCGKICKEFTYSKGSSIYIYTHIFCCGSFCDVTISNYIALNDRMVYNEFKGGTHGLNWDYYLCICLEGLKLTTNISHFCYTSLLGVCIYSLPRLVLK